MRRRIRPELLLRRVCRSKSLCRRANYALLLADVRAEAGLVLFLVVGVRGVAGVARLDWGGDSLILAKLRRVSQFPRRTLVVEARGPKGLVEELEDEGPVSKDNLLRVLESRSKDPALLIFEELMALSPFLEPIYSVLNGRYISATRSWENASTQLWSVLLGRPGTPGRSHIDSGFQSSCSSWFLSASSWSSRGSAAVLCSSRGSEASFSLTRRRSSCLSRSPAVSYT